MKMAASFETSQNKGSDVIYDVCCSVCAEDSVYKEGLFYCQKCSKSFCNECVLMHNRILKDHSVSANGKCDNWSVNKKVDDTLELCEEHATEKLTMFCEDHEKLLCQLCLFHNNHRQCSHVVLLSDKCKSSTQHMNVADIASKIEQCQKRLTETMIRSEQNKKSLQKSYETILKEILDFRRQINDTLDRLQQQTVKELDKLYSSLTYSLDTELKTCVTFISKLKIHTTKSKRSPEQEFILNRKYIDQTVSAELFLQKAPTSDIEFQHNTDLETCLAACTDLGKITNRVGVVSHKQVDPNEVIRIKKKSTFHVRSNTDKEICTITGICEMANGNLVISDFNNRCVKLLDQAYNVIGQEELPTYPRSICSISPDEIAVTMRDEIHFLRVDTEKIITIKHIQLNHSCYGIATHKGDMFVTSGTALLQYTTDGRLVKKLYEDTSSNYLVVGVAVSPDGKRIYLTDKENSRLVTLAMDGAVTATLQDPAFKHSRLTGNIHVAATGQSTNLKLFF
ncbi:hypothetical protein DPMN_146031 [Dreissena polymorpha]|uniref:B box-type domain-containing protein n=1 Tax=Dreissena polymorpha TaxID=45954 RepID=A0A9D4F555_DREPO|nr:hypothetical protein DPMN_146031 [Dreissena polymorpha]